MGCEAYAYSGIFWEALPPPGITGYRSQPPFSVGCAAYSYNMVFLSDGFLRWRDDDALVTRTVKLFNEFPSRQGVFFLLRANQRHRLGPFQNSRSDLYLLFAGENVVRLAVSAHSLSSVALSFRKSMMVLFTPALILRS